MIFKLKDYQKNFIQKYDLKKQQYKLNGYILAFDQGLGKTFTSLSLMHGLNKDCVIIIAPKSTLNTVWYNEIETVFKEEKNIYVIGDNLKEKPDFFICNYESIGKLHEVISSFTYKNIGIIVDECHNFKNRKSKRVTELKSLTNSFICNDILFMSGTPIKAMGEEMIPILSFLDPMFTKNAQDIFKEALGLKTDVALSLLKNRLGMIMHRKMKSEVLTLPKKHHLQTKIKIPHGDDYILENVKKQMLDFITERKEYYKINYFKYEKDFYECINYLKTKIGNEQQFKNYLEIIEYLQVNGYDKFDQQMVEVVKRNNEYEKKYLRQKLPNELKRKFDKSKSVIKYVDLKIMGEVIGGLLNKMRAEMFSLMIDNSPISKIIENGIKKTVCFTTYVDVAENTYKHLKQKGFDPLLITGKTSSNIKNILKEFKTNVNKNPIIATVQTMSTGVTIIEANNIIFLNQP
jgi:superfamily II DNA or RNA helicase